MLTSKKVLGLKTWPIFFCWSELFHFFTLAFFSKLTSLYCHHTNLLNRTFFFLLLSFLLAIFRPNRPKSSTVDIIRSTNQSLLQQQQQQQQQQLPQLQQLQQQQQPIGKDLNTKSSLREDPSSPMG